MATNIPQPAKREIDQPETPMEELAKRMATAVSGDGSVEPWKGLLLVRASAPRGPLHSIYDPVLCVVAQGSKEVFLGQERYLYDPAHYLLVTAGLPLVGHIREASPARPYLSLRLTLDPALVGEVAVAAGHAAGELHPPNRPDVRAIHVSQLDAELLDAVVRLVRLVDRPAEAHFLAPLITREIVYRLWRGEQSNRLRYVAAQQGYNAPIARAIERLHQEFDQPLNMEHLARELGMSASGFHHRFKTVTAMSPLQFQKRLRLQEARRLMLGEGLEAADTAYRVGYNDASQFNREYKRQFGLPPARDLERLRVMARPSIGLGAD